MLYFKLITLKIVEKNYSYNKKKVNLDNRLQFNLNYKIITMKRKLLYLTTIVLFSAFSTINAQTKVWDFGNWVSGDAYLTTTTIDNLTIVPGSGVETFGVIEGNPFTFSPDGYSGTKRFKFAGTSGGNATTQPTSRYLSFPVTGACVVKVWFRTSSSATARTLKLSDGTNPLGSQISGVNPTGESGKDFGILNVNYTGGAATLYLYGESVNLYKIEVTGVGASTLGINDFQVDASSNVFSNGKLVFVSNVKSDTQVDVYGISGVLVKSFKTGSDTSFDLNTGIYVVKSKSAEGQKTAKVLVN